MTNLFDLILKIALYLILFDLLFFTYSLIKKRQDIADVVWGIKFILIGFLALIFTSNYSPLSIVTFLLICIWGLRLFIHIGGRHLHKSEDKRYIELSKNWGKWFYLRSLVQSFLFQGLLALTISLPVIAIMFFKTDVNYYLLFIGLLVWAFGFIFETIADYELKIFIKTKKESSEIMSTGLWKYSRHPNYFGEVLLWWGIFILSLHQLDYWHFSIIGPLTITILILFVSGIPLNEKRFEGNRNYDTYKKRVSPFLPLPPKK